MINAENQRHRTAGDEDISSTEIRIQQITFYLSPLLDSYSIYNTSDGAPLPLTANRDLTQRVARLQQCWCRLVLTALELPRWYTSTTSLWLLYMLFTD
jgi:hypothetical protein